MYHKADKSTSRQPIVSRRGKTKYDSLEYAADWTATRQCNGDIRGLVESQAERLKALN